MLQKEDKVSTGGGSRGKCVSMSRAAFPSSFSFLLSTEINTKKNRNKYWRLLSAVMYVCICNVLSVCFKQSQVEAKSYCATGQLLRPEASQLHKNTLFPISSNKE